MTKHHQTQISPQQTASQSFSNMTSTSKAMNTIEKIAVLGATGSIGSSTLDILANYPDKYQVYAISGYSRLDELLSLCKKFRPVRVAVADDKVDEFVHRLQLSGLQDTHNIDVVGGQSGLIDIAEDSQVDTVVASIVGSAGLASTLAAVKAGKRVLLANKESLVMAGNLMMDTARQSGAVILPVDSEHNAIFQCLPQAVQIDNQQIHNPDYGVRQLWLTASGGPFLYKSFAEMQSATVEQAVNHPNWSMGQKISVDSATMMNKGLELIEACYLFNLPEDKIKVAIHPQSIIHSMAEYVDGSILAQMGTPDMRTPIANCLAYPNRIDNGYQGGVQPLDLFAMSQLEFIQPDLEKFANLKLARQAMQETQNSTKNAQSNWATISLNASNEVAVASFLQTNLQTKKGTKEPTQTRLTDIADINQITLDKMADKIANSTAVQTSLTVGSIEEIMALDKLARSIAKNTVKSIVNE